MSNFDGRGRAMADEDWVALRQEILALFTPGAPVDEVTLFAGRSEQIQRLQDALASKGRHAVLFGERGVGKTSVASIFHINFSKTARIHRAYVQCGSEDEFSDIWRRALKRIRFSFEGDIRTADQLVPDLITPDDVEIALSYFMANDLPIFIFDEFDRVRNARTKELMASTIKQLSNTPTPGIILIVGVADNVPQIIDFHPSIVRQIVQVHMPRMNSVELRDTITKRLRRTKMKIDENALWKITYLASGLPFYAHALGQASALMAIKKKSLNITENIVQDSIPDCFADLDYTILNAYVKATVGTRKGNIFKEVIAACALAEQDELGRFSAADVEAPLTAIMGREMKTPSFSFHLNEICEETRGAILEKTGSRSHFRFRFTEPMMQPYVTIKSLAANTITNETLIKFSPQRQRELPL